MKLMENGLKLRLRLSASFNRLQTSIDLIYELAKNTRDFSYENVQFMVKGIIVNFYQA